MQDLITTPAIVLKVESHDEYDRRVVLLTSKYGKITAFARGARRQNNKLLAKTDLFCFGEFKLYPGRNSYSLSDANITNYFEDLRNDFNGALYGMYFLELMEYNTRENNDEKDLLNLLYMSLRALVSEKFDNILVKTIFELKSMMLLGEFRYTQKVSDNKTAIYALDFLYKTRPEKIYSFTLKEDALLDLVRISSEVKKLVWPGHSYNSEEMLKVIEM